MLLAGEAVSALDLSARVHIVELFKRLATDAAIGLPRSRRRQVAYYKIIILEQRRILESGPTRTTLDTPPRAKKPALCSRA